MWDAASLANLASTVPWYYYKQRGAFEAMPAPVDAEKIWTYSCEETDRFKLCMLNLRSAMYEDMDRVLEPAAMQLSFQVRPLLQEV